MGLIPFVIFAQIFIVLFLLFQLLICLVWHLIASWSSRILIGLQLFLKVHHGEFSLRTFVPVSSASVFSVLVSGALYALVLLHGYASQWNIRLSHNTKYNCQNKLIPLMPYIDLFPKYFTRVHVRSATRVAVQFYENEYKISIFIENVGFHNTKHVV